MKLERTTVVYLVLVLATLVPWLVGAQHGLAGSALLGAVATLLVSFGKAWLVGWDFMDVCNAPRLLRVIFSVWIAVVATVLTAICAFG